jgi:hypothetical protein
VPPLFADEAIKSVNDEVHRCTSARGKTVIGRSLNHFCFARSKADIVSEKTSVQVGRQADPAADCGKAPGMLFDIWSRQLFYGSARSLNFASGATIEQVAGEVLVSVQWEEFSSVFFEDARQSNYATPETL